MKFLFQILRFACLVVALFLLFSVVNPKKSIARFLSNKSLTSHYFKNILKVKFIGEIVGYSYIKIEIESTGDPKRYKYGMIPLKGSCYEAISGKTFKIIGSYNTNTLVWKFDCFNPENAHMSVFTGKESRDGNIEGKWNDKKNVRDFYLKRAN